MGLPTNIINDVGKQSFLLFLDHIFYFMRKFLVVITALLFVLSAHAQKKIWVGPNSKIFNFQFHYTYFSPGGDFSSRYNGFNSLGGGLLYKNSFNLLLGTEGSYHFGNDL